MMDRRVAMTILAILFVGLGLYACTSDAQTAPEWIGTALTTGKTPVFETVIGDKKLSMVQVVDPASWVGTFWGRDYAGTWTRITPMRGATASDTLMTITSGSPFLRFNSIKLEVIVTTSGTASFWGE